MINLNQLTEGERKKLRYLPLTEQEQSVLLRSLAIANGSDMMDPVGKQVNSWLAQRLLTLQPKGDK